MFWEFRWYSTRKGDEQCKRSLLETGREKQRNTRKFVAQSQSSETKQYSRQRPGFLRRTLVLWRQHLTWLFQHFVRELRISQPSSAFPVSFLFHKVCPIQVWQWRNFPSSIIVFATYSNQLVCFIMHTEIKVIPKYCIAHPYCARFLRH